MCDYKLIRSEGFLSKEGNDDPCTSRNGQFNSLLDIRKVGSKTKSGLLFNISKVLT